MTQPPAALVDRPSLARKGLAWLRVAIGVALVAWLISRVDVVELERISTGAALRGGAVAIVLLLLAQLLSAWRWQTVLGDEAPSLPYLFRLYLVGQFFGLFLPTSVGGDAVRAVSLARATGDGTRAVASILADRLLGVLALGVLFAIGLALRGTSVGPDGVRAIALDSRQLLVVAAAGVVAALLVWGLWRGVSRRPAVTSRLASLRALGDRPPRVWGALALLALAVQGCYVATWGALVGALQLTVPPSYLLFAVPAVSLAAMAPFTLSGLGIREGTWMALLAVVGVAPGDALASSLLYFVAFTLVGAMGGLWFALHGTAPRASDEARVTPVAPPRVQEGR